jgi:hypothetical protein
MSPTPGARVFTLDAARAMLPRIQELTAVAAGELDPLMQQLEAVDENAPEHARLHDSITSIVTAWAEAVQDLGAEAKGLWLVDFDAGNGYYCWKHPESTVSHYHGYDDGFAGRMKIV